MNQIEITAQTSDDAAPTPPAIRLSGVSKSFANGNHTLEVLKNVNLTVRPQAIVGLIGASGSGKSTLLNIISGILRPDRGQVCICGAASEEFNDWRSVSYMFQDDRLLPGAPPSAMEFALSRSIAKRSAPGALLKRCSWWSWKLEEAFPYQLSVACEAAWRSLAAW
jgi:ABC-type Mn2+/Zn2+ transport system ATPase subunit